MTLKLETKADYQKTFEELIARVEALEASQPSYKQDPVLKMPALLKESFLKARKEFLPLQMTGKTKKDGKLFANLKDYLEATNKAFKDNGIIIDFVENKDDMKLATIILKGNDRYSMETPIKPANVDDPDLAVKYGFLNAKTNVYKSLSQLVIAKREQLK